MYVKSNNTVIKSPGNLVITGYAPCLNIHKNDIKDLILLTNNGCFIKYNTKEIKTSKKGELGIIGIDFKDSKTSKVRVIKLKGSEEERDILNKAEHLIDEVKRWRSDIFDLDDNNWDFMTEHEVLENKSWAS